MLIYSQASGKLTDENDEVWGYGYSGHGEGKNNPALEGQQDVGPIPRGRWRVGPPYDSPRTGPYTLGLTAMAGTATFGRADFRIHGDSKDAPGTASHGCIILAHDVRERIENERQDLIEVV